jgi:hypothetical protein
MWVLLILTYLRSMRMFAEEALAMSASSTAIRAAHVTAMAVAERAGRVGIPAAEAARRVFEDLDRALRPAAEGNQR